MVLLRGSEVYEFEIPLNSGDSHDIAISPRSMVGMLVKYRQMYEYEDEEKGWLGRFVGEDGWPGLASGFNAQEYGKLVLVD